MLTLVAGGARRRRLRRLDEAAGRQRRRPRSDATPLPTPSPADLTLARSFERNGQYEEAEAAYAAVIAEGSDADRQAARLALARLALAEGRLPPRLSSASSLSRTSAASATEADFLLARAYGGMGYPENAIDSVPRYIDEGGVASANAHAESAYLLLSLGRVDEAQQEAEAALSGLPESLRPGVILSMAQGLEESSLSAAAIDWYQRLFDESDSDSDKALALQKIGSLEARERHRRLAGRPPDGHRRSIPSPPPPRTRSTRCWQRASRSTPYVEALVYYRHFQNDEAMQAFQRYLEAEPAGAHAAAAHYYVAAIDERLGDDDAALEEYAKSLEIDPSGDLADDALWWSGLILEKQSRWDEASDAYGRILLISRVSHWAEDAGFRQGLVLYKQERYQEAANAWRSFGSGAER